MKNEKILNIVFYIMMAFAAWVAISTLDVMAHNLTTATYARWNFWELLF